MAPNLDLSDERFVVARFTHLTVKSASAKLCTEFTRETWVNACGKYFVLQVTFPGSAR